MGADGYGFFCKMIEGKMIFFVFFVKVEPALCAGFLHLRSPTKTENNRGTRRRSQKIAELFFFVLLTPLCGYFYLSPATLKSQSR
jgi:hypothetical protein